MRNDAVHFENLLIRICLGDVEFPHHSCPGALAAAAAQLRFKREKQHEWTKRSTIMHHLKRCIISSAISVVRHLPGKTMCSCDHPGTVHQDSSTHQSTVQLQIDQPGPAAWRSGRATHYPGTRLCDVLHRRQLSTTRCCKGRRDSNQVQHFEIISEHLHPKEIGSPHACVLSPCACVCVAGSRFCIVLSRLHWSTRALQLSPMILMQLSVFTSVGGQRC